MYFDKNIFSIEFWLSLFNNYILDIIKLLNIT